MNPDLSWRSFRDNGSSHVSDEPTRVPLITIDHRPSRQILQPDRDLSETTPVEISSVVKGIHQPVGDPFLDMILPRNVCRCSLGPVPSPLMRGIPTGTGKHESSFTRRGFQIFWKRTQFFVTNARSLGFRVFWSCHRPPGRHRSPRRKARSGRAQDAN